MQVEGVGNQLDACCCGKRLAEGEIAVAVHDVEAHAGIAGLAQGGDDVAVPGVGDIVADPDLEQVAEDVQGFCLPHRAGEKVEEQRSRPG